MQHTDTILLLKGVSTTLGENMHHSPTAAVATTIMTIMTTATTPR